MAVVGAIELVLLGVEAIEGIAAMAEAGVEAMEVESGAAAESANVPYYAFEGTNAVLEPTDAFAAADATAAVSGVTKASIAVAAAAAAAVTAGGALLGSHHDVPDTARYAPGDSSKRQKVDTMTNNTIMPRIVMPPAGKGTGAVSSAPMVAYSTSKRKLSRRPGKLSRKFLRQLDPYVLYRFQGLNNFNDRSNVNSACYGLYPMRMSVAPFSWTALQSRGDEKNEWKVTCTVSVVYMPMYAYNLSALPAGKVFNPGSENTKNGVAGYSIPFYQLKKQIHTIKYEYPAIGPTVLQTIDRTYEFYAWDPIKGSQNSPLGAQICPDTTAAATRSTDILTNTPFSSVPFLEQHKYVPENQAPVYNHAWSDIRLAFSGNNFTNSCYRVSIVNFLDESVAPNRIWTTKTSLESGTTLQAYTLKDVGGCIFRDLNDTVFYDKIEAIQSNMTFGQIRDAPPLNVPESPPTGIDLDNIDVLNATSFWEAYWGNRIGHPLAYSKNFAAHHKYMNKKYSECIRLPAQNGIDPNEGRGNKHIHSVFKAFNKTFDTSSIGQQGNTSLYTGPSVGAMMTTGFNTMNGTKNSHVYGNNFRADDWLLIEADMPFQYIPATQTTSQPMMLGGVDKNFCCYTPYVTPPDHNVNAVVGPLHQTAGFDISIRSKYNVISHGQS